jgi:hypothetical protein
MTEQTWHSSPPARRYQVGWRHFIPFLAGLCLVMGILSTFALTLWRVEYSLAGGFVFFVGYLIWAKRRFSVEAQKNQNGVDLMIAGHVEAAGAVFEDLCRRPSSMGAHVMFIFNRAVVYQCLGDFETALGLYHSVLNSRGRGPRRVLTTHGDLLRTRIAETLAWYGNLDAAEALLEQTCGMDKVAGARVGPTVIIHLRRGNAKYALTTIEDGWSDAEALLLGVELKPLRILWAYILESLGQREAPQFVHHLAQLDDRDLDLNIWMGAKWPEMAVFLQEIRGMVSTSGFSLPKKPIATGLSPLLRQSDNH